MDVSTDARKRAKSRISDALEPWGIIPSFLSTDDPRPAIEQFRERYIGGWRHMAKFQLDIDTMRLKYPGDRAIDPLSAIVFRDELLVLFESAWVVVLRPDGTWEVSRMD